MTSYIIQHLTELFERTPGLDGTIHGARRIVQGKHGSRSSLFFSAKNNSFMPVESRLERNVCYRLECDPGVENYRMQPIEIPFGSERLYPDICARDSRGTFHILEVKPKVFVSRPENRRKADFLRAYFSPLGIDYSVVSENYCGCEAEVGNMAHLYNRGGRMRVSKELLKGLSTRVLRIEESISMEEAASRISQAGVAHYYLEAALFHGYLKCDMHRPISQSTIVKCGQ